MLSDVVRGGETAEEIKKRTAKTHIPCLVIWGRDDKVNIITISSSFVIKCLIKWVTIS